MLKQIEDSTKEAVKTQEKLYDSINTYIKKTKQVHISVDSSDLNISDESLKYLLS